MLSGDLLLDLEQERPHILIGLNRRNGMRSLGDIGGQERKRPPATESRCRLLSGGETKPDRSRRTGEAFEAGTFNRLRKYTGNSRISVVCWRLADVWRADLWIFAVLPGEESCRGTDSWHDYPAAVSSLGIRTKLYAAAVKVNIQPTSAVPRWRVLRKPPAVLIQPNTSSMRLRPRRLTA